MKIERYIKGKKATQKEVSRIKIDISGIRK